MPLTDINYVAILVAGVLSMGIGKGPGPVCALVTVTSLMQAYVLAHFVDFTNASTWFEGAQTGT